MFTARVVPTVAKKTRFVSRRTRCAVHKRQYSPSVLNNQIEAAHDAQRVFKKLPTVTVASVLNTTATLLDENREKLIQCASKESRLALPRCDGELTRTMNQLRLFANIIRDGTWVDARINGAIKSMLVPIGPVAVFGASNFPLAFSTVGGDTASALAAKCTVVYKTHPGHPETTQMVNKLVQESLNRHKLPGGVFQITEVGVEKLAQDLVSHPKIQAVGFTGSRKVGDILTKIASQRPVPIPVYAEMGSVNPVFILPGALSSKLHTIAEGLSGSFTLGCGQFCTNPGLVFVIGNGSEVNRFIDTLVEMVKPIQPSPMLTDGILASYRAGIRQFENIPGVKVQWKNPSSDTHAGAVVFTTTIGEFLKNPEKLQQEIFGPSTLIVKCNNLEDLAHVPQLLEGQLTATFHATDDDGKSEKVAQFIGDVSERVGRILWGGFPTGVEVNHAMQHGGPYPASSNQQTTSVGARAILRWVRPLCYQGFPEYLLPPELQNANTLHIGRMVDGKICLPE